MSVNSQSNIREFQAGIRAIMMATKRTEAEVVNRALKNVAFRAMQYTPHAEPGMIQAELYRDNILIKMATSWLKKKEGAPITGRGGRVKTTKSGKIRVHGGITRAKIAAAAARLLRIRLSRVRAIRAGWIPAVKAFGGTIRGASRKSGGSAQDGIGVPATPSRLYGFIQNSLVTHNSKGAKTDVSSIPEAVNALNDAIATVAQENINYARKNIEDLQRRYSDKR